MMTGASGFRRRCGNAANAYVALRRRSRQTQLPVTAVTDPRSHAHLSQEFSPVEKDGRRTLSVRLRASLPGDDVIARRKSGDDVRARR